MPRWEGYGRPMPQFEVSTSAESDPAVVALVGEGDLTVREELTTALLAAVARARVVVVDLAGLRFLDSTGIHALVMAYHAAQREGVRMYAVNAGGVVADLLDVTGVGDLLAPPGADGTRD
jgi:anti-sigma B factor antagonist